MTEPFTLYSGDRRWVVHPPRDPYGDGYVRTFTTELHADGMTASTTAEVNGQSDELGAVSLAGYLASLAADWSGWDGVRRWASVGTEALTVEARHDRQATVHLTVVLGEDRLYPGWSAQATFEVEPGEQLTRLAADLAHVRID
jgi:hypothetical protein